MMPIQSANAGQAPQTPPRTDKGDATSTEAWSRFFQPETELEWLHALAYCPNFAWVWYRHNEKPRKFLEFYSLLYPWLALRRIHPVDWRDRLARGHVEDSQDARDLLEWVAWLASEKRFPVRYDIVSDGPKQAIVIVKLGGALGASG